MKFFRTFWTDFTSKGTFWIHWFWYWVPSKQVKSRPLNLKHFVAKKEKYLEFHINCLWECSRKSSLICDYFTSWNFRIVDLPSINQKTGISWLFVGFPELGGIAEISQKVLKGNETFQLFFGVFSKLSTYRWENVFGKSQIGSILEDCESYPLRFWFKISVEKNWLTLYCVLIGPFAPDLWANDISS